MPRYVLDVPIVGAQQLTKFGGGTLVLARANPFSSVSLTGGALVSQAQGALGTGPILVSGNDAALEFENVSQSIPGHVTFGPQLGVGPVVNVASHLAVNFEGGVGQGSFTKRPARYRIERGRRRGHLGH
jgi:hypothetical protein